MTTKYINEFAYVVISPAPGSTRTRGGNQIVSFKIGTASAWDNNQAGYTRANPDYWYRPFLVRYPGDDNQGAAGDLFGKDGPKQILNRIFACDTAPQALYTKTYDANNTEWWETQDPNCIAALRNLQTNWDNQWAQHQVIALDNHPEAYYTTKLGQQITIATLGTVQGAAGLPNNASLGPVFTRRFGAVYFFRDHIGLHSLNL